MASDIFAPILTGAFALGGGLGGVLLSGRIARGVEKRRISAEDARRWLTDRRQIYAAYLGLAEAMLQEIDRVAAFLSYNGTEEIDEDGNQIITDGLLGYYMEWEEKLQPALGEVQLMATPEVADLADRVSGALMEITADIELRQSFVQFHPGWYQARDLVEVLRNSMRIELGLPALSNSRIDDDWPWLASRPSRESYGRRAPRGEPRPAE